jgi:hypothetical protein
MPLGRSAFHRAAWFSSNALSVLPILIRQLGGISVINGHPNVGSQDPIPAAASPPDFAGGDFLLQRLQSLDQACFRLGTDYQSAAQGRLETRGLPDGRTDSGTEITLLLSPRYGRECIPPKQHESWCRQIRKR